MEKITFKQYLESKEQLLKAINESPIHTATYTVNKYCKVPVGETKDLKEYIHLKPKHQIVVEWKYEDEDVPEVLNIRFKDVVDVDNEKEYTPSWVSDRFRNWLMKNARENY